MRYFLFYISILFCLTALSQSRLEYPIVHTNLDAQNALFNPAYVLTTDSFRTTFNLSYEGRTGIQKNVKNSFFQLETVLPKTRNHIVGINYIRYQSSKIIGRNRLNVNYKYRINFSKSQTMSFGTSLGIYNLSIADNPTGITGSSTVPDVNVGIVYQRKTLKLGGAVNQLLNQEVRPLKNAYLLNRYYSFIALYDLPLDKQDAFIRFHGLYNLFDKENDISSAISYYFRNKYGVGLGYRNFQGVSILLNMRGIKLEKSHELNLSFSASLISLNSLSREYQINLIYRLGHFSPRKG